MKLGDESLTTSFATVLASGAVLTCALALYGGPRVAFSGALGAVIALSNLYVLSRIVAAVAVPEGVRAGNAGFAWGVLALGKIMVLFGGIWFLMTHRMVDPIPMVVGYGSLPIGIAIGAVLGDKTR